MDADCGRASLVGSDFLAALLGRLWGVQGGGQAAHARCCWTKPRVRATCRR
jgi:hypothetical protein